MNKLTKLIILFLLFVFSSSKFAYGATIFEDNFDSGNFSKWNKQDDDTSWTIDSGRLKGSITSGGLSFLYANYPSVDSDYVVNFDSENVHGIDQHIMVSVNNERDSYYIIDLRFRDEFWPQDGGSVRFWKYVMGAYTLLEPETSYLIPKNLINSIRIEMKDNLLSLYINDGLVNEYLDPNKLIGNGIGFRNYAGSYNAWPVTNYFDNVLVSNFQQTQNDKTILIPGMGASWNEKAIVFNQEVPDSDWKMTPFVDNYDKLIESLGDDVLAWNYDWRKPVAESVIDLEEFINKNIGADEKFSIIGHSMGGVLGRMWLENNLGDARLTKVTTLGSPHMGSIDAYRIWAGGNISENIDVSSIALNILVQLQNGLGENRVETIRRYAPALKDLSPTFDFIKKNGKVVKNSSISIGITGNDKLLTYSGFGFDTERWVKLTSRNKFEEMLGWWPDGKILGYEMADGDKTVLTLSSDLGNNSRLNSDHGNLPNIFIDGGIEEDLRDNWVFYMGSPAKMKIVCDGKEDIESDDFIVIKKELIDGCKLKLVGKEDGVYHFVYGINGVETSWGYRESEIKSGEEVSLIIDSRNNTVVISDEQLSKSLTELLLELKKKYPRNKDVDRAIAEAKKKDWKNCVDKIFDFRDDNKERVISNLVIEELALLMDKARGSKVKADIWTQADKIQFKMFNIFPKGEVNSYLLWTRFSDQQRNCMNGGRYACVESRGLVNSYLYKEIIL